MRLYRVWLMRGRKKDKCIPEGSRHQPSSDEYPPMSRAPGHPSGNNQGEKIMRSNPAQVYALVDLKCPPCELKNTSGPCFIYLQSLSRGSNHAWVNNVIAKGASHINDASN